MLPRLKGLGRCSARTCRNGRLRQAGRQRPEHFCCDKHNRFVAGFLAQVAADQDVVLVLQDWGSGLHCKPGRQHPDTVRGLAYL